METDGELSIPTMATTTTTVNKQTQPQQQQTISRHCKKPGHMLNECRKRIRKEQEQQGEKTAQNQPQKHTHLVYTAKELSTEQTCAGMAQTRILDPKDVKLKFLTTQQSRVLNQ